MGWALDDDGLEYRVLFDAMDIAGILDDDDEDGGGACDGAIECGGGAPFRIMDREEEAAALLLPGGCRLDLD